MKETVLVLGASENEERYSYKATKALLEAGHTVIPVKPKLGLLLGQKAYDTLTDVTNNFHKPIQTITMYVGEAVSQTLENEILSLKPTRVIFNPGAENKPLMELLKSKGVDAFEACTLVLLKTNQY